MICHDRHSQLEAFRSSYVCSLYFSAQPAFRLGNGLPEISPLGYLMKL